jgi:glycolate oxidase
MRGPALIDALVRLLGAAKVLGTREDLIIYEYDGAVDTATPDAVVLPNDTMDVAKLARFCHEHNVPIVPRGAGTGLSGGAIPVEGGVVVSFARMARILEIDVANRRAVVQPGLINLHLSSPRITSPGSRSSSPTARPCAWAARPRTAKATI